MKFSFVFLLVAILALLSISATAYGPRAVCYRKTQKCCYLFRSCGFIVKKLRVRRPCPYKVCKKECRRVCYPHCKSVHVTVPYQKCYFKPVRVCRKVKTRRGRVEKCKYERKRHCRTYYKKVWKRECHPVCERKCHYPCHVVRAVCVFDRIFHHPKFCPHLKCYRPTVVGPSGAPRDVISPKGRFIRATKPIRTDIGRRRKH